MHLSVGVTLRVKQGPNGHILCVGARAEGVSGEVEIPWDQAFGPEIPVPLLPPSGGQALRPSPKTIRRRSSRQERRRIEAVGGRSHAGSGALPGHKSDGSLGNRWRMENKFTTAASYRVTLADLHKLRSECRNGQAPVFNVDFQERSTGATKESWVLIPSKVWERLVLHENDQTDS